jgi:hypothetical protein
MVALGAVLVDELDPPPIRNAHRFTLRITRRADASIFRKTTPRKVDLKPVDIAHLGHRSVIARGPDVLRTIGPAKPDLKFVDIAHWSHRPAIDPCDKARLGNIGEKKGSQPCLGKKRNLLRLHLLMRKPAPGSPASRSELGSNGIHQDLRR